MARINFISQCKWTLDDCTRLLQTNDVGPSLLESTLTRLETMQRSLEWARGRLLDVQATDCLLGDLAQYINEVTTCRWHEQKASSSYQAPLAWTGARGPPHFSISPEQLSFLKSCGFTVSQTADILHVSSATVKRRLRRFNLTCSASYSDMSDSALDEMVKDLVVGNDLLGPESVRAQLRSQGICVQRRRVRECMRRVDPRAAALRTMTQRLHRRAYRVAGPNSLMGTTN
ncbi:uncharacterized protein LOC114565216 [Perca flavescens]|uniref:uncharacterized protein LOC114565216 n=1 Tax=Perca flavescens TaxID=8167 RepID=UPI00106EFCEE|nr:uncharacterized protein LOC114565216 [Perca flavescens]